MPTEDESREYLHVGLQSIWDENKRFLNPQEYPVDLSKACWDNKHKRIFEVAVHVKEMKKIMSKLQDVIVQEMQVKPYP